MIRFLLIVFTISFYSLSTAANIPDFKQHTISDNFNGGYQVHTADLNGDGLQDIIGLSTTPSRLIWFENPSWNRYVITTQTDRNIDVAPYDINGDGRVDLALASAFNLGESIRGGLLHWLRNPDDPTDEWPLVPIGAEPTSHRLRWAQIRPNHQLELVNVPIIGPGAVHPEYSVGARLLWFQVPQEPESEHWQPQTIDTTLHVVHGITVVNWDDTGLDEILTASFEGVHLFQPEEGLHGITWTKTRLGAGKKGSRPAIGASEVELGHSGPNKRFIASIEPWHGNEVVIYTPPQSEENALWHRTVLDTSLNDGHALKVADLNHDGGDEIIAGFRREPYQLYIYSNSHEKSNWRRSLLDDGDMGAAGLEIVDLDGDGDLDILAIGTHTGNIKWYENLLY